MQFFVINLEKDSKRRVSVQRQLEERGLTFEFFPAVYGRALSPKELQQSYSDAGANRIQCRSLTPSEIGCALSHIGVYREIIRRNLSHALILEDDVQLGTLSQQLLKELAVRTPSDHPMVVLLSPAETRGKLQELAGGAGLKLGRFAAGYFAHSYIVTLSAAQALLQELYPVKDVADCWKRMQRHRVVDILAVTPALVIQDQGAFGSSTTRDVGGQLGNRSAWNVLRFKLRRAFWLGYDGALAIYNRNFHRYAGLINNDKSSLPW